MQACRLLTKFGGYTHFYDASPQGFAQAPQASGEGYGVRGLAYSDQQQT